MINASHFLKGILLNDVPNKYQAAIIIDYYHDKNK